MAPAPPPPTRAALSYRVGFRAGVAVTRGLLGDDGDAPAPPSLPPIPIPPLTPPTPDDPGSGDVAGDDLLVIAGSRTPGEGTLLTPNDEEDGEEAEPPASSGDPGLAAADPALDGVGEDLTGLPSEGGPPLDSMPYGFGAGPTPVPAPMRLPTPAPVPTGGVRIAPREVTPALRPVPSSLTPCPGRRTPAPMPVPNPGRAARLLLDVRSL